MIDWTHVMIHHSLTPDGATVSWGSIRHYHVAMKGWADIGYHFGIEMVESGGRHYLEVLRGRPLSMPGAHCREGGMNRLAIGVCLVGDYDDAAPSDDRVGLLVSLVRDLTAVFTIPPENIVAHRDYAPYKTCPGSAFDLDRVRKMIL